MKSFIKFSLFFIGIIVISLLSIPFFVDVNQHKSEIESALKEHADINVSITGDVKLSLFPWIGIELNGFAIHDPTVFGSTPLLYAKKIQINAKLMPLLKKRLEMKTVTLNGLNIKLTTLKDGSSNWAHLTGSEDIPPSSDVNSPATAQPSDATALLTALSLGGILIEDASLTYQDALTNTDLQIEKLNLTSGSIAFDQPINFDISAIIHSRDTATDANFSMQSQFTLSQNLAEIHLQKLTLKTTVNNAQLLAPITALIIGTAKADLNTQTMSANITVSLDDALKLNVAATGQHIIDAPQLSGKIQLNELNPRILIEKYLEKLDTADPTALTKVSFVSHFKVNDKQINLKDIQITVDETTLRGSSDILLATPHYAFSIQATDLDLDRYLPPLSEESNASSTAPVVAPAAVALLPVETLRELSLKGDFSMQSLIASGLEFQNINIHSEANEGIIHIAPFKALLYGGNIHSNTTINAQGKEPIITIEQQVKGIKAGPFSQAITGKTLITGTANLQATLKASGNSEQAIQQSLHGTATFSFADGAIQGINIADTIRRAKAKISGRSLPQSNASSNTDFTQLTGDISIQNMKVFNKNLTMKSPYLRIVGHGDVDLNKESINYLTDVKITGSPQGQGGKDLKDLIGLTIPVRIGGTFDNPSYYPDVKRVLKNKVKQKTKQRLKDEIKKKLGFDLKGLF